MCIRGGRNAPKPAQHEAKPLAANDFSAFIIQSFIIPVVPL